MTIAYKKQNKPKNGMTAKKTDTPKQNSKVLGKLKGMVNKKKG